MHITNSFSMLYPDKSKTGAPSTLFENDIQIEKNENVFEVEQPKKEKKKKVNV